MIEHERLAEIEAERREIDAREAVLKASLTDLNERHTQELAEWAVDHDLAVDLGAGPPSRPDPPDTSEIDREILHLSYQREKLKVRERKVLAEILPEVVAAGYATQDAARELARPHLDALAGIFRPLVEAHRDVLAVRGAADLADPNHRPALGFGQRARTLPAITLIGFVESVLHDVDLLAVRPLPSRPATTPQVDLKSSEPARLGLTTREGWGTPPKDEAPKRRSSRDWT